jgi:mono/diheme cytochrome c family protein
LHGAALVALHGSWNRTRKDGYKVVSLHWQTDGSIVERDFMTGFLAGEGREDVIGRPVDVAEGPDGSFFVSDDYAGAIYRVAPSAASAARPAVHQPAVVGVDAPRDAEADHETRARGAALYEEFSCADCHEPERAAEGIVALPLTGLEQRYDVGSLAAFFEYPAPPMPVFPMDAADRAALAAHLLALDR